MRQVHCIDARDDQLGGCLVEELGVVADLRSTQAQQTRVGEEVDST